MRNTIQNIILAVISGIMGFMAYPPFGYSFMAWICFIPLLFAIRSASNKNAFLYAYLSGMVFFGGLLYWLVNVTVPGTFILILYLALFYGIFGVVIAIVLRYSMDLFVLPFAWVVIEYIRSNIFTGFSWGLLGYSQYENIKIIQISDITGAYGVSFLLAVFNIALFAMLIRSTKKMIYMMVALLFIITATSYGMSKLDNYYTAGTARISVVQGNIPQTDKWDAVFAEKIIDVYDVMTREAAKDKPDMIVWPETSYPYLVENGDTSAEEIRELASDLKIPVLAGIVSVNGKNYYNEAVLIDKDGKTVDVYRKTHLVPFGEYIPCEKYADFLRRHIDKSIGDYRKGDTYTLFPIRSLSVDNTGDMKLRQISFHKFGVLICFEDIFPYITREFVRKGADFMVTITNDAWFNKTAAAAQHLQASVFRAVENRVPVVRAANTGISCFVDSTGNIMSGVGPKGRGVFIAGIATGNIDIYPGYTYYTVCGDVFVYFCAFMMLTIFIVERFFSKKRTG